MTENGIHTPLQIRHEKGKSWIINGHHRQRQALDAGHSSVPVLLRYNEHEDLPQIHDVEPSDEDEYSYSPGQSGHYPGWDRYRVPPKTAATAYDPEDDDHYRSYTDWDKTYSRLPEDIHRGVAVQLDPDTHEAIHGEGHSDVGIGKKGNVIDITAYFKTAEDDDYRMQHRPPNEQNGRPLHHLDPDDEPDEDEHVRIYRSVPPHVDHFDTNTWATTNPEYAHQHGRHPTDPSQDWPVMSAEVPKSHVYTDFNDDNEVGYQGPRLEANELEQHHEDSGAHTPFTDYQPPKEDEPEEYKPKKGEMWGSHVLKLSPEDYKTVTEKSFMPEAAKTVLKHLGNGVTWHPKGSKHTPLTVHDQSDHWHAETHAEMLMGAQHPEGHHEPGTAPLLGVVVHTKNGKTIDRVGVNPHVDYSDKPSGFYNGFKNLPVSRAAQHPSLKAQSAKTWVDYFGVAA
jgi:hypothetical protein